jgi:hypothetical protein
MSDLLITFIKEISSTCLLTLNNVHWTSHQHDVLFSNYNKGRWTNIRTFSNCRSAQNSNQSPFWNNSHLICLGIRKESLQILTKIT